MCSEKIICEYCVQANLILWEKEEHPEKEISQKFLVSRTPVREALLKLAAEGFVDIDSYRKVVVKKISYEELKEIYEVLGALDRLAMSLALDNITPKTVIKLEQIVERMGKNNNIESIEKYLKLNTEFHNEIWKAVKNKILVQALHSVRDKLLRYNYVQIYAFKKQGALEKSLQQHKDLIQAIVDKDKPLLKSLIVNHRGSLWESSDSGGELREYLMTQKT
jgi:DNA-binding GntR family transcriptional regulator